MSITDVLATTGASRSRISHDRERHQAADRRAGKAAATRSAVGPYSSEAPRRFPIVLERPPWVPDGNRADPDLRRPPGACHRRASYHRSVCSRLKTTTA